MSMTNAAKAKERKLKQQNQENHDIFNSEDDMGGNGMDLMDDGAGGDIDSKLMEEH